jgi:hypothetical protein
MDLPPGLMAERKLCLDEHGKEVIVDFVDARDDKRAYAAVINSGYIRGMDPHYVVVPTFYSWLEDDIGLEILSMDKETVPLSRVPRERCADPKDTTIIALQIMKSLEYMLRYGSCHLALCPESIYLDEQSARIGELWFCRAPNGEPINPKYDRDVLMAIPKEARVFSAPEIAANGDEEVGGESDYYSFALLLLYLFAGYVPNGTIEHAPDRNVAIKELYPAFDEKLVECIGEALNPSIIGRGNILWFRDCLGRFARSLGVDVPPSFFESPVPGVKELYREAGKQKQSSVEQ